MPLIQGSIGLWGAMIPLRIGPTSFAASSGSAHGPAVPNVMDILGLIDTGASCSAIDPQVLGSLNLVPTGFASIHTPSTGPALVDRDLFEAVLTIGAGRPGSRGVVCQVIECELASQGFFALIGRDVLSKCSLTYDGPADRFVLEY